MKDVQTANPPPRSHRTGPRTQLLHGRTNTSVLPRCTACTAALISLWQDRREEDVGHVLCQFTPPKTPEDIFYFISFYYIWFHLILRRKRSCRQSDLLVVLLVTSWRHMVLLSSSHVQLEASEFCCCFILKTRKNKCWKFKRHFLTVEVLQGSVPGPLIFMINYSY